MCFEDQFITSSFLKVLETNFAQAIRLKCSTLMETRNNTVYTLVHRFNNRWRWCRFASSIFKTMRDDMHKLKFKQFYYFSRRKILFFILWVINFHYL